MSLLDNSRNKLTYVDYVEFPDDGARHEIIGGEHYVTPSPSSYHQSLSLRLAVQLYAQVEKAGKGRVLIAPLDVLLSDFDIVQPDLLVVSESRTSGIKPKNVQCAPDLAIEILSQSTAKRDQQLKKSLYQRVGVAEYWIVDPQAHVVEQYCLDAEGADELQGTFADKLTARSLSDVHVDLREIW